MNLASLVRTALAASLALAVLLTGLRPPLAWADDNRRVAVVRLDFQGATTEVAQGMLSQRLVEALAAANFQVFAGPVVAKSCRQADCYQEIARALGVRFLITGKVTVEKKNYEIALELVDGQNGRALGSRAGRCELCGIREAGTKMEDVVRELEEFVAAASPSRAKLLVDGSRAGVPVTIDGQARGATPLEVELDAGEHRVAFGLGGGAAAAERTITLAPGGRDRIFVELLSPAAAAALPGEPPDTARPWRRLGWWAVGAGAAALVAGLAVYKFVDGRPLPDGQCTRELVNGRCPQVYEARVPSGMLIGGGAVALALGGLTLYLSSPGRAAAPASSALVLGAAGRF